MRPHLWRLDASRRYCGKQLDSLATPDEKHAFQAADPCRDQKTISRLHFWSCSRWSALQHYKYAPRQHQNSDENAAAGKSTARPSSPHTTADIATAALTCVARAITSHTAAAAMFWHSFAAPSPTQAPMQQGQTADPTAAPCPVALLRCTQTTPSIQQKKIKTTQPHPTATSVLTLLKS